MRYNFIADSHSITRRGFYEFLEQTFQETLSSHGPLQKVLIVGAGGGICGTFQELCDNNNIDYVIIDIDIQRSPQIVSDLGELAFFDSQFDCIICSEILEHVLEPQTCINEMHRCLRNKGTLIFSTRFIYPLHDIPGDYLRYTRFALDHFFTSFSSKKIEPHLNWIETLAVLLIRLLREDQKWVVYLSLPIYISAKTLHWIGKRFGESMPSDIFCAGYLATLVK